MLKQTIYYVDFDDNNCTDTLYFNITKSELADNLDLQDRFDKIQKSFEGPNRDMTTDEIRSIIDLVKTFMHLSYGERSPDGKRFVKNPLIWEEFTQTAAYDAFLFSLFSDPQKAIAFLLGVLPADLRKDAEDAARAQAPELFAKEDNLVNGPVQTTEALPAPLQPDWMQENREPTQEELASMSKEELFLAMKWKTENKK